MRLEENSRATLAMKHRSIHLAIVVAGLAAVPLAATAQRATSSDEREVLRTIDRFFEAMAKRDTALARTTLVDGGGFYAVRSDSPQPTTSRRLTTDFVKMLATPGEQLRERIWNPTVHIDATVAQVWAPYDFHRDGKFSHCGTDSFSLIRTSDGWRIAEVVYTVQQSGCTPSPLGAIK